MILLVSLIVYIVLRQLLVPSIFHSYSAFQVFTLVYMYSWTFFTDGRFSTIPAKCIIILK